MPDRTGAFRAVLESLGLASRFQQGRRLFRTGAVQSLTVSTSVVVATVRDADPETADTHRVRIAVRAFTAVEWRQVEQTLSAQAIHVATLLAGEVPDGLAEVLAASGLSLLPLSIDEVALSCSCRSWQEPCTHVIATWYALAEEFERDPFAMFAWRGRGRDELLDRLRTPPSTPAATPSAAPRGFWRAGPRVVRPARLPGARRPDAILDQLDPLPLTVGRHEVTDLIRPVYTRVVDPDL
ncbi:MAG: hypothetical protein IRY85_14110 [Micromonosporaceae bacterium]|nr:hypothetical protein [Micromonosporaceae bacterium]